jgi:hypothetical protein
MDTSEAPVITVENMATCTRNAEESCSMTSTGRNQRTPRAQGEERAHNHLIPERESKWYI